MLLQISASAGAGKTYTLTELFLSRLRKASPAVPYSGCRHSGTASVYSIQEILAATFTNKAAAEMKERIIGKLKESALEERRRNPDAPGLLASEKLVYLVLRHFGLLQIRTIDSLLTMLVRLSSLTLGLPPDFTPSFTKEEYFVPLYDALMQDLVSPENAGAFLSAEATVLRKSLEDACSVLVLQNRQKGFFPGKALRDTLHDLFVRLLTGKEVPVTDRHHLQTLLDGMGEDYIAACLKLSQIIETEELDADKRFLAYLGSVTDSAYTRTPSKSSYAKKTSLDACLNKSSKGQATEAAHAAFAAVVQTCRRFFSGYVVLRDAMRMAPLSVLAHELHARYEHNRMSSGLLPAPELPVLAARLLSGESGVSNALCRMGAMLTHIFLDEFQDTSLEQWESLLPLAEECLAKGGTVTYVGDVKQAIYSWRGGEASLFYEVLQEPRLIELADADSLPLSANWRSDEAVVEHNNRFFGQLAEPEICAAVMAAMMPEDTPDTYLQDAAVKLQEIFRQTRQEIPEQRRQTAASDSDSSGGNPYPIRLSILEGDTVTEVRELVSLHLQQLFSNDLAHRPFSDIAILTQTKGDGAFIANQLAAWGIPVITESGFQLAAQPLISRLGALLSFLSYPPDDLAFWEFVSSPECYGAVSGQNYTTLADWLAGIDRTGRTKPLFQLFAESFPKHWKRWIEPFYSQAGLMSAYDLLSEIIRRFRLTELYPEQTPFLRRLLEVAHLAETEGHISLPSFLEFWTAHPEEQLPLPENMNAVRIMTIHAAKGLEFPVVIIPFHHASFPLSKDITVAEVEGQTLLTRISRELPDLYYPACTTEYIEELTLLYVAWTRPRSELHVFLTKPGSVRNKSPLAKALDVLVTNYVNRHNDGYLYDPQWQPDTDKITGSSHTDLFFTEYDTPLVEPLPDHTTSNYPDRLPADVPDLDEWRPMSWLPALKIFRSPLTSLRCKVQTGSSLRQLEFTATHRGTLAHLCLELLVITPAKNGETQKQHRQTILNDVNSALQEALYHFALPLASPETAAQSIRDGIVWFAEQSDTPRWLEKGLREQQLISATGQSLRADLLVPEQDVLLVVDYKTGEPHHLYTSQLSEYMQLLRDVQPLPVEGRLVYLDQQLMETVRL